MSRVLIGHFSSRRLLRRARPTSRALLHRLNQNLQILAVGDPIALAQLDEWAARCAAPLRAAVAGGRRR